jgi:hypothetical protein
VFDDTAVTAGSAVNEVALPRGCFGPVRGGKSIDVEFLLWILAVILVIAGIVALFRRQILWGVVLIVVGLLVGPGGVSIFT